jgi:hypothetical protein
MTAAIRILFSCAAIALMAGCIAVPGRQERCPWPPDTVGTPQDPAAIAAGPTDDPACG